MFGLRSSGFFFFFFKQKTAYEMRISDWSSDVCSSDLSSMKITRLRAQPAEHRAQVLEVARDQVLDAVDLLPAPAHRKQGGIEQHLAPALRELGRASCRERVCQYV